MATVTIRPQGFGAGVGGPGRTADDGGQARGRVVGWTEGAARRNVAWLQSVDPAGLDGLDGWALTLTMGGYPGSPAEFHGARRALVERLRRAGYSRIHWVVEATALGRPHLHLAVYGGDRGVRSRLDGLVVAAWVNLCSERGWPVTVRAQTAEPITSVGGWMQYVSKHGARGVKHYQRSTVPVGWEEGTGRLWGHHGDWPIPEPLAYSLEEAEFHRFRRLVVGLVYSRLRALGMTSTRARRFARRMRHPDSRVSASAGLGAWLSSDAADALVSVSVGRQPVLRYDDFEGVSDVPF